MPLCLQLLETVAENIVAVVGSNYFTQEDNLTQYSQLTQNEQSSEDSLQLLEIYYLFARNTAIGYPSQPLCKLLQWLVQSVSCLAVRSGCEVDKGLKLQLLVLSELIKISAGVKIYLKELKTIKKLYRSLTILLNSTENPELLVFSMTILARLVLLDSMGSKLFSEKNVKQAFELIFSVLDGSWRTDANESMSMSNTILDRPSMLPIVSIDLLCDLGIREDILELLKQNQKTLVVVDNCLMSININGDTEEILIADHFLASVVRLNHVFQTIVAKSLFDLDILYRVLQTTLHPSKLVSTMTAKLIIKVIGDDVLSFRTLFESLATTERLNPIVGGMARCIADATAVVQNSGNLEVLSHSDDYLQSVVLCHVLAKLSSLPVIRSLCADKISLNQSATLIQAESALTGSVDPQILICFQPQLSIHLMTLLSSLVSDEKLDEKIKRTLILFLRSSEVSKVLAAALSNRTDKTFVVESLLLLTQLLTMSEKKHVNAFELSEEIFNLNQRVGDSYENFQSTIATLQASADVSAKKIEKLQTEMQQMLHFQDQLKAQQDQALAELGEKFIDQIRQKDDAMQKIRDAYEDKLREITLQCESMGQHMNKQTDTLQQREALLQESRAKRGILEEKNTDHKRKIQALEIRIEEIAQTHSTVMEEMQLREKRLLELREKIAAISEDYTTQREELASARDDNRRLESELKEQEITNESTYKELVLLSKAYKALADDKMSIESEVDTIRDEMAGLESMSVALQSRLQGKKELADQLAQKVEQLDDAVAEYKNALGDEHEKRCTVSRELDELKKAHRKLESMMVTLEIQVAEQRLLVNSKDEYILKCEADICHLTEEVGKQANLQALIHQLSSGVDNGSKVNDSSSVIAHDK
ncbi:Microtubule-associated proteins [Plasmopara halstedii]|uniref:Microtubule-associated proteins n=1 Tax=Plasmopara halstedii TaxID=4781 RepID=A0A0P1A7W1_PLAHL|nr:Microtubule-associated proteins [Plasmopara halstedii]CEG36308.1 Microtubule-associated proteins [Plasmopara halstedii]|eukprot:XP_024572677.1 Microtubule-associated proteins [Plasmopara halstedii]